MVIVATFNPASAEATSGKVVHFSTMVVTGIWSAAGRLRTQPEAHRHMDGAVVQVETKWRPSDESGSACNHAPDFLQEAAKR